MLTEVGAMLLASGIGAGASFGSTGLSAGISKKNLQRQAKFQDIQATKQRDWASLMDNTKFQRTVHDMESAGLNPAMMFGSGAGGVNTPSGSSAGGVNAPGVDTSGIKEAFKGMTASALQAKKMKKELELVDKQIKGQKLTNDRLRTDNAKWSKYPGIPSGQQLPSLMKNIDVITNAVSTAKDTATGIVDKALDKIWNKGGTYLKKTKPNPIKDVPIYLESKDGKTKRVQ